MGKRAKALIITAAGVILVGGVAAFAVPVIYRDYFVEPAATAPKLSASDTTLSQAWPGLRPACAGLEVNSILPSKTVCCIAASDPIVRASAGAHAHLPRTPHVARG